MQLDLEAKATAQDVVAQQAVGLGLRQCGLDVFDQSRGIVPGVNETLLRTDGIGADDQPFEHLVRVAREHGAVHERSGLALVAVDDDVLGLLGGVLGGFPLRAGRKAAAAASAQIGLLHLVEHLVRRHAGQGLDQCRVAADGQVVLDAQRVDADVVAGQEPHLVLVVGYLVHVHGFGTGQRIVVDALLEHFVSQRRGDDAAHVFGRHFEVADVSQAGHDVRTLFAIAMAAGHAQVDLGLQTLSGNFAFEGAGDGDGIQTVAGGTGADRDAGFGRIAAGLDVGAQRVKFSH